MSTTKTPIADLPAMAQIGVTDLFMADDTSAAVTKKVLPKTLMGRWHLSWYDDLAAAVAAISATEGELVLDISDSSNATVPTTLSVRPIIGNVMSGTVTWNGTISGDPGFQWLSGSGHTGLSFSRPEWWGVDGTADDVEIGYAGTALDSGGTLQFIDGKTYTCAAAITWTSIADNWTMQGKGVLDFSALGTGLTAIRIQGALSGTSTTASAAISIGDTAITVASESGFTANKMVSFKSTEDFDEIDSAYKKSELAIVLSTAASTLNLNSAAKDDYSITALTVTIAEIDQIENITVKDIKIIGGGAGSEHDGLILQYVRNALVENVKLIDVEDNGIVFNTVYNGTINNCEVIDTDGGGATPGYAYNFSGPSNDLILNRSYAENFRHAFSTTSNFVVRDSKITKNIFYNNVGNFGTIDTHNNSYNTLIDGNTIEDGYIGISLRGPKTTVSNNRITGVTYSGISTISADSGMRGLKIQGNYIEGIRGMTISPFTGSSTDSDVEIIDNELLGVDIGGGGGLLHGINCQSGSALIANNKVRNFSPGIYIRNKNNQIIGNTVADVRDDNLAYAFYVDEVTVPTLDNVFMGNTVLNNISTELSYHFFVDTGVVDTLIEGNYLFAWTGAGRQWINDSGTRTRFRKNWITDNSDKLDFQRYGVMGVAGAGVADGTTAGKAKTTNATDFLQLGRILSKAGTDDLFDLTGVSTGAGEYIKVLLCIDYSGAGQIVEGIANASQTTPRVPDWWDANWTPVGVVEIDQNYSGGDLAGNTFYDIIGMFE